MRLAMLLVVVAVATNGDRLTGVLAAVSTAVWFDFFLTQPYERFTMTRRTTSRRPPCCCWSAWRSPKSPSGPPPLRDYEQAGRLPRWHQQRGAGGGYRRLRASPDRPGQQPARTAAFAAVMHLSVRCCRAWPSCPAAARRFGHVRATALAADGDGFPADTDVELLAEGGGVLQGRFLMTPVPGARPGLEQRLLAVAFADQVGAALASAHPAGQRWAKPLPGGRSYGGRRESRRSRSG